MAKAYWISFYSSISNPDAIVEYGKLAGPAIQAGGGRVLARGLPTKAYEAGLMQRTVLIEFDSVQQAIATHDSAEYQLAVRKLEGAVVRELRIIEALS
jgi:uncharacterized protein (DUF1330 family)